MARSRLDHLFAAFQRSSEPALLAQVFDATAPELLRVARFLAADAHGAEDLVQTTFQKAIEHRGRYDPALPVLPWLLGILANAARHERRQRARTAEPAAERAADPAVMAEQAELQQHLLQALRGMPQPYREVLVQRLEQGLDTAAIAEATGRKPATVRTQVARGMDLLRRALPAGIGASVAVVATPGRGLAAVRSSVLQSLGVEGTVPVATTSLVIGVLTMKKVLLAATATALVLVMWMSLDRPPAAAPGGGTAPAPAGIATTAGTAGNAGSAAAREMAAAEPHREAPPAPVTAMLVVSVRHAAGGAAAGIGLYVLGDGLGPLGREATTDGSGRAAFADLPAGAIAIKPDRAPAEKATLTAGDNRVELTLPAGIEVAGRVVDPARGRA